MAECARLIQAIERTLGMTRGGCEELLARSKKTFVRQMMEEVSARAVDDLSQARKIRQCVDNLGVNLRRVSTKRESPKQR